MSTRKHSPHGMILILLWLLLGLMFVGLALFFYHDTNVSTEQWSVGYWAFIVSIFSAVFSGLNVLVFYQLTVAVEKQNDKRQEEMAYYDGLKYSLVRQSEIIENINKIIERYQRLHILGHPIESLKDIGQIDGQLIQDKSQLQLLHQAEELFPSVCRDDVNEILALIDCLQQAFSKQSMLLYAKERNWDEETENHCTSVINAIESDIFAKNGDADYLCVVLFSIREGMWEDANKTLLKTLKFKSEAKKTDNQAEQANASQQRYRTLAVQKRNLANMVLHDLNNTNTNEQQNVFTLQDGAFFSSDVDTLYMIPKKEK